MQKKSLTRVRIKDADQGIIEAVFASHLVDRTQLTKASADVIDKDGDVTLKGAFTDGQPVVISAYGHGSWEGKLPVGKGTIREEGDLAIMTGQFFLKTTHGRDTWEVVKALSEDDLQEWSYSLHDVKASRATVAGRNVQVLEQVGLVKEVSPVLMGSGVETRTIGAKGAKQLDSSVRGLLRAAGRVRWAGEFWPYLWDYDLDEGFAVFHLEDLDTYETRLVQVDITRNDTSIELGETETEVIESAVFLPKQVAGLTFSEHIDAVMADVDALTTRASEVVALRAGKGKSISASTADHLRTFAERVEAIKALVVEPTTDNPPDDTDEAAIELLRFVSLSQGVTTP